MKAYKIYVMDKDYKIYIGDTNSILIPVIGSRITFDNPIENSFTSTSVKSIFYDNSEREVRLYVNDLHSKDEKDLALLRYKVIDLNTKTVILDIDIEDIHYLPSLREEIKLQETVYRVHSIVHNYDNHTLDYYVEKNLLPKSF